MITFRDLTTEDLDAIVRWRNDPAVNRYLSDRLRTKEEVKTWLDTLRADPGVWSKAIIDNGQTVGYATVESIDEKNRKCELVLIIGEVNHWGKGVGAHVISTMLRYAFDTLRMHRVWAVTTWGNDRSEHLLERAGFRQEGVMRETILIGDRFSDLVCYSILENEYRTGANPT